MTARRRRALALAPAAVSASLALTGCWNSIPLGHRALVQILTVDPAGPGDLRWTFFQANPTAIAQMGSGGGSASPGGGTTSQQVIPISVVAPDLGQAFRKAQTLTSRDLYLGQLQEIVVSERLKPGETYRVIDNLAHTPELDQSQTLFATPALASAAVLQPDPQELFPATYLDRLSSCPSCTVVSLPTTLMQAFVRTRTAWGALILPEVSASPKGIAMRGAAVYRGTRLVSRLDSDHEVLLGYLLGKVRKGALAVHVPGVGYCAVRSMQSHSSVEGQWQGGRLTAQVHVRLAGELMSVDPDTGENLTTLQPAVATALSAEIIRRAGAVASSLMAKGADPLLLGEHLWAADPSRAPSPAVWRGALRRARVTIRVDSRLRSQGGVR